MLFLSRSPHFMSMLGFIAKTTHGQITLFFSDCERKGQFVALGSVLALLFLLLVSLAPTPLSGAGLLYAIEASVLATAFLHCGIQVVLHRTNAVAKRLLLPPSFMSRSPSFGW